MDAVGVAAYGTDYARLWNNELHPKGDGYDLLAKLIETELKSHGVLGNLAVMASK